MMPYLARIIHEEARGEQEVGVWVGWWGGGWRGAGFAKAERSDLVLVMVFSSAVVVLEASWPKVAAAPGSWHWLSG